jgi:hypothetical protein
MRLRRMRPGITPVALTFLLAACGGGSPSAAPITAPPVVIPSTAAPTPSPTVDQTTDPRIGGAYVVAKTVTGVKNFTGLKVGDVLHRTYHVAPSCPIGPCGGSIRIVLAESKTVVKRELAYDAATHTYDLVPITSPVICTGVDGRRYKLKDTTDTVHIDPLKTAPTGVDVIVTRWSGKEVLRAVPHGRALNKGHCRSTTITYRYRGTLQSPPS